MNNIKNKRSVDKSQNTTNNTNSTIDWTQNDTDSTNTIDWTKNDINIENNINLLTESTDFIGIETFSKNNKNKK